MLITHNISRSISRLQRATEIISEGKFDYEPDIKNQDELGDLSKSFIGMAQRLKVLEALHLDASPLTHLPGSAAIENELQKRIGSDRSFAFCLIDLDNFKAFNDHYGYARGNEVLVAMAQIIIKVIKKMGDNADFVGHIGGDDFVVITDLERYQKICDSILKSFSKIIVDYYDQNDKMRGYITAKARDGAKYQFPIMSLSIAVVTSKNKDIRHYLQISERAAELKSYAKSKVGSLCVVDSISEGVT